MSTNLESRRRWDGVGVELQARNTVWAPGDIDCSSNGRNEIIESMPAQMCWPAEANYRTTREKEMGFVVEYVDAERFAEFASPANRRAVAKAKLHFIWEHCAYGDKHWAIDHERNAYFFAMRVMDYNGPSADFYLLNFEGAPIVVRIDPRLNVAPLEVPVGLEGRLADIRRAIRDALAVIGYGGIGRLNEFDSIAPKFD